MSVAVRDDPGDDRDREEELTASPSSPSLARAVTSWFSATSLFSSASLDLVHDPHATPVPGELIDQFLSELDIRFPHALASLRSTGEIKRADPVGSTMFATRILRAQKLNVKSAVERADEHARWRQATLPDGVMELTLGEDVAPQMNEEKVFLVLKTKAARPCLIVRVVRHTAGLTRLDSLKQYIVYCMELAVYLCDAADNPDGKIDVVFDARGMKWANYDVKGLKSVFEILEKRFFERIHVIYMYDGPRLLVCVRSIEHQAPSLPLSLSPSLPLSLPPSLPLSLSPSLPLSLSLPLPLSLAALRR